MKFNLGSAIRVGYGLYTHYFTRRYGAALMPMDLLKLSWQIQLALGSGYAAYLICYAGVRSSHTTVDTTFLTLVFSLVATGVLYLMPSSVPLVPTAMAGFLTTILSAILWRRFLRASFRSLLRQMNVTWSDDDPSALATIIGDSRFPLSQVSVLLDDGTWLMCQDTSGFEDAPFGPCRIGPNGDIALYLTSIESPDGVVKDMKTVRDPDWGDRLTYIPAGRIRQITLRHSRNASRSSPEVEEGASSPSPELEEPLAP